MPNRRKENVKESYGLRRSNMRSHGSLRPSDSASSWGQFVQEDSSSSLFQLAGEESSSFLPMQGYGPNSVFQHTEVENTPTTNEQTFVSQTQNIQQYLLSGNVANGRVHPTVSQESQK